ncbi:phage tail protein [Mucilaginibacter sp. FT3.2]|uniref:phage tail protein n=1 Tax=Mucilaginibacter sp. FT3.2 TaxID=2723090 RepID=UPI001614D113|nr:tail fiber protein [Mucilaginibacter sp. FT3.2]MBB6230300.1 microcystin-dependent protein [Mucilaginibacter sp. FT3.2]
MEPYIGEIKMFAGTFAPLGWFFCDGTLLPISQYNAFFALIGTTYGGDGVQTFQLPDLRGRAPVHSGNGQGRSVSRYELGQVAGVESTTITAQQLPSHSHLVNAASVTGTSLAPAGGLLGGAPGDPVTGAGATIYTDPTVKSDVTLSPTTIAPSGGNQPLNIVQPVLAVNFIIAWQGIWPQRP